MERSSNSLMMTIRLSSEQMRRLDNVIRQRQQTKQAFVMECTMLAVAQYEENNRSLGKLPPIGNSQESVSIAEVAESASGLGIVAVLRPKQEERVEAPPTQAPVVVQVGNGAPAPTVNGSPPLSDLDRLAIYVVKGDEFLRDVRKRTAVEVLRTSANTDEEFNVLVAQLEQNVAIKMKVVEENSGVTKIARMAWDKLNDFLRGTD